MPSPALGQLWRRNKLVNERSPAHIRRMGQSTAIIIGAVLIAAAILFVFRYEMASPGVMLLDRWTGSVVLCNVGNDRPTTADCDPK